MSETKTLECLQAREAAESLIRAKDRFLAILSHELRTPLTPVFSALHMLMDDPDMSGENKILLEIIEGNIGIEMQLIEDLLDMTRLTHGKIVVQLRPIDAHDVVRKALAVCMPDIERKSIRVTADLSASHAAVNGDSMRLQQVIWNLLKNSAKFTPEGGSIYISTSNDSSGHLIIRVADTGIGIDQQMLPLIFNAFEQGEDCITQKFGGLGLGLAISRMLMEMLGGQISASSDGRGRGAAFTVEMDTIPEVNPQSAIGCGAVCDCKVSSYDSTSAISSAGDTAMTGPSAASLKSERRRGLRKTTAFGRALWQSVPA